MAFRSSRFAETVCEPVVSIEGVISKVVVQAPMKLVRSRASVQDDLPTRRTAEFRCKRRCLHSELLQRLNGDQTAGSTNCTKRLSRASSRASGSGSRCNPEVRRYAVNQEIVAGRPLSGDAELACRRA